MSVSSMSSNSSRCFISVIFDLPTDVLDLLLQIHFSWRAFGRIMGPLGLWEDLEGDLELNIILEGLIVFLEGHLGAVGGSYFNFSMWL